MGIEKQSSARGNYAGGGFLQMFDWNAKSRKKLFTTNSDVPEQQSKQKKRCDGNLPMTRLQILDEDENAAGSSSIKECSDHSRASSVIDDGACGTRGAGVVARLMGLNTLPKSSLYDPYYYPTLLSESHSLHDASSPVGNDTCPKYEKVTHRPIEKFQTEILPPKSARSIPITHHKLLSPLKNLKSGPWKDAARIMEVAARIIEPGGPHGSGKTKLHMVGSSSVPLKVRDLKEKVQKQSKQLLEGGSRRKTESHHVKSFRGHSTNKGLSEASCDSDESSVGAKTKGKSISLALLAKANVQRRESLRLNSSRSLKEPCEIISDEVFKDQLTQKSLVEKESSRIESNVLRQNNQKQNSIIDGGKLSKCSSKGATLHSGESASARQPNVHKLARTCKAISRNSGSEIRDDNKKASSSSTGRITHKKRSTGGEPFHSIRKDKNGKATAPSSADTDKRRSLEQRDDGKAGMEIVSFTFRSPMTRSVPDSGRCAEASEESGGKIFALDSPSITSPSTSDVSCASKSSLAGYNVKGSDALSILLEQKLKELSLKVELSQQNSEAESLDGEHGERSTMSSTVEQRNTVEDSLLEDNQVLEDFSISDSKISRETKLLDCRLPSPVSVLEHFSFGDSCNSSETSDRNSPEGSKQCSSIQMLDSCSLKTSVSIEVDGELSDSACSTFAGTIAKVEDSTAMASIKNKWESKYIKELLRNIEPMFMDYALGRSDEIISPHLFNQGGNRKLCSDNSVAIARTNDQRLMFDCVRECLDTRCMHYACGGFKLWTKGVSMARQKDRLAEQVYREISDWSGVGDSMIDELVDQDMSSRRGKWLNFDCETFELGKQIESRLVKSLVNEAVADMLGL